MLDSLRPSRPASCSPTISTPSTASAPTAFSTFLHLLHFSSYGYDEINLNCGCPSDRVAGAGCFGAALMTDAHLVARCMAAMGAAAAGTPVNVKCRRVWG